LIDDNSINSVIIPANCTDLLQPLDLSVNKAVKNFLGKQFEEWYAKEALLIWRKRVELVDLCLTAIKPLLAQWMTNVFNRDYKE